MIVDIDASDNKRNIVAFIGGLDLCVGRYDTPKSCFQMLSNILLVVLFMLLVIS